MLTFAHDKAREVDAVFADLDDDGPGVAVAVVNGTEIVYLKTFGMANLEHGVPITTRTTFDIASISKQFGAMTAILLEQEGTISFSDLARDYVPELGAFGDEISLQHLLNHTSGLRDWPQTLKIAGVEFDDVISFEKIMKMLERQEALNFEPGSAYAYSNTGYNLLAEALARVSSQSFRELTTERIFEPLAMQNSFFLDDYREVVPHLASSYSPDGEGGWRRNFDQLTALASSSLHTTIEDFTRWMVNFETKTVGGADGFTRLTTRGVLNDGTEIPYALGIVHGEYRGLPTLRHGGSWAGFRTTFLQFPTQQFSIAIFANFATARPAQRADKVADIFLAGQLEPVPVPQEQASPSDETFEVDAATLATYSGGYYSSELDTTYSVAVREGGLEAQHFRNETVRLTPAAEDAFKGDRWWFGDVRFLRDADGNVEAFEINAERVRHLRFEKRGE